MRFYLGTHMPHWLRTSEVPLFVSHRRLDRYAKACPRAVCSWALDSGGFTELSMFGEWRTTPEQYVEACRRYVDEVGPMDWAAPMDWMCEPFMIAKTGLTIDEHQKRTTENFHQLVELAPDVPFVPVLQGWEIDSYLAHVDLYTAEGVDLTRFATVGVGSVCRRQSTEEITEIFASLAGLGLHLHGFGVKGGGLARYAQHLTSADSMAWSRRGRNIRPCPHTGASSCGNCQPHALAWRRRLIRRANR